jgi:hypothetical protein
MIAQKNAFVNVKKFIFLLCVQLIIHTYLTLAKRVANLFCKFSRIIWQFFHYFLFA